ncbi:MAG: ribonuclease HIII [Lentisphaerae bacterium]|nr:ribonuclease HIII [Lentisphaerota bacterium]
MDPSLRTSFTYPLTEAQQIMLMETLRGGNYRPIEVPYAQAAAETDSCRIILYQSGKCLIQGRAAQEFVTYVLEPKVLLQVGVGYEEMLNPQAYQPHMGIDESGKGDFFGPMVIAGAYADNSLVKAMLAMGVKDSKNISSDLRAQELARDIRKLLGKRFSIVLIGPQAYNRLYAQLRSVNSLLAWGHARAIENLLAQAPQCPRAISDQFGNQEQVKRALMRRGRGIELVQRHHAEADMAVAAASILARAAFLNTLVKLHKEYNLSFPKGASDQVKAAAEELVKKHGAQVLLKTAKCHFRTTDQVLEKLKLKRADIGREGLVKSKPSLFRRPSAKQHTTG